MKSRSSSSGLVFLTTLIDLLIQIVFLLLLINAQSAAEQGELVNELKSRGLSINALKDNWHRLVDIDSLEKGLIEKQHRLDETLRQQEEQLTRLRAENDALRTPRKGQGGRDLPPCWETNNHPDYLLSIEIREDGLWIKPAWEPNRDAEARALGLNKEKIEGLYGIQQFRSHFGRLKQQGSKCSHFVIVTDDPGTSKLIYKRHLNEIESIFYKKLF